MLWRKMFRDIKENKLTYIACIFVIVIGLLAYTSMSIAKEHLFLAKDNFYEDYQFADGFIELQSAPMDLVEKISEIEGIDVVEGRLIQDVRVLEPSAEDENTYLRLISIQGSVGNELNQIHLMRGSFPEESQRQILIANKFFDAHQIEVGQQIQLLINGEKKELSVSGSGQSPEYVYTLKNLQSLTPDPETFEVAYIPYQDMEVLLQQVGTINNIVFTLDENVEFKDVEKRVESVAKPYGIRGLYSSEDQLSNALLTQELNGLEQMVISIPIVFLGIASIILYIMLRRLVESQRGQIGTMKAFGYHNFEILIHYISYGFFIGFTGGLIGGIIGNLFSIYLIDIYQMFFSFPNLEFHFTLKYIIIGIIMSVIFSVFASFQGVKSIIKLKPAEAMRPPAPAAVKKSWIEKIPGFLNLFTMQGRMALRNILRNKIRSLFTLIGVMLTFSIMASFLSLGTIVEVVVMDQFTDVQKQDVKLTFSTPMPLKETVREIEHIEGILHVEPLIEVPISLTKNNIEEDFIVLGIEEHSNLYNIFDKNGKKINVPKTGIMLSKQIAEKLNVEKGDVLFFNSPYTKEENIKISVEDVVPQYLGTNAYMNLETLLHTLKQGNMTTSLLVSANEEGIHNLKNRYNTSEVVENIEVREEMIEKYNELMKMTATTLPIMAVIAIVTGFAIVYNSSIISLAERKRELASLRILGMNVKEVMEVISFEQWMIGFLGIILGIPLAFVINQSLAISMSSDYFTLPGYTSADALVQAFLGTMLAIWISQRAVARKVKRLDLVGVLKERE